MKLARLFLAVFATSVLAACGTDLPTAPPPQPSFDQGDPESGADDTCRIVGVDDDGAAIWSCAPLSGSGG
jgi:hypothetical protein